MKNEDVEDSALGVFENSSTWNKEIYHLLLAYGITKDQVHRVISIVYNYVAQARKEEREQLVDMIQEMGYLPSHFSTGTGKGKTHIHIDCDELESLKTEKGIIKMLRQIEPCLIMEGGDVIIKEIEPISK